MLPSSTDQTKNGAVTMKKKITMTLIAALILCLPLKLNANSGSIVFNENKGTVSVKFQSSNYEELKVVIQKDSKKYNYNLYDGDETFPLQMGNGTYTVGVYQRVAKGSNRYRSLTKTSKNVSLPKNAVYLASVQNVDWSDKSKAIQLAKELKLKDAKDEESFKAIYDKIVATIVYDHQKAKTVGTRYLPVIDTTLSEEKGICYDYSSLMAAMLRSIGIPTKMIHGNSSNVREYHAWNEVLLNDKWVIIDTTIDAQLFKWGSDYKTYKPQSEYENVKEF